MVTRSLSSSEKFSLFEAARTGDLEEVKNLVKKGGTEQKNEFGWTPIMMASLWGNLHIVKYLNDHSANLEAKSKLGINAIMLAALHKRFKVVDYLSKFQKTSSSEI